MKKKENITKPKIESSVSFWKRARRAPYQSLASVFMIFLTLLVLSIFLLIASTSSSVISYFEKKPQITVFFKDELDQTSLDTLIDKIYKTEKVLEVTYISKEEALSIYREHNKDDPLLLEMVTADILPSSLEISTVSPEYLSEVAEIVSHEPGVDEVVFQKEVVDTLISWTTTIRRIGLFFLSFLLISTFLILFTSIGMKIANKKDEIEILKLVGATSWYIRRPFILEGVSYGISGAILAFISLLLIVLYAQPFMSSFLAGIAPLPFFEVDGYVLYIWPPNGYLFLLFLFVLIISGFFMGLLGSLFAVNRYMKE